MSLTSYRAAPPRVKEFGPLAGPDGACDDAFCEDQSIEEGMMLVLGRADLAATYSPTP